MTEERIGETAAALEVRQVHTYYGSSHVLQGVSLSVRRSELVALLGRNGAGKTTTVRTIGGFTPPREGRVLLHGRDVTGWPPYATVGAGLGLVLQGKRAFPSLTVQENIRLATRRGSWTPERVYDVFPRLRERRGQRANSLSGGEQQMLAMARALLLNPTLLVLDEPSEGLSPAVVQQLGEVIRSVRATGMAILLVEQNLALALHLADRVLVMNKGQLVFEGGPQDLTSSPEILHQYLGV